MKLVVSISIEHAIDFEDIAVRIRSREFVARAVKAKNELLWHMRPAVRNRCSIAIHLGVAGGE